MSRQKVRNMMSTDVATVLEGTPFKEVAMTMAHRDVSAVPVVDKARHVLGVVSEADLLVKQGTQEIEWTRSLLGWWRRRCDRHRAEATTAGTLMSKPAITVTEGTTVAGAARVLTQHRVKRLPVIDAEGRLVGIVSRKDLLTVFLRDDEDIRDEIPGGADDRTRRRRRGRHRLDVVPLRRHPAPTPGPDALDITQAPRLR